jgi:hypothetical protein
MAGKKLTVNVLVLDAGGNPKVLEKDSEMPAEYADQVGDHCFDEQGTSAEKPARPRARAAK